MDRSSPLRQVLIDRAYVYGACRARARGIKGAGQYRSSQWATRCLSEMDGWPTARAVIHGRAPYLVLILIGMDQRGVLQLIASGRRFFAIFADEEREWIERMITERFCLLRAAPHRIP